MEAENRNCLNQDVFTGNIADIAGTEIGTDAELTVPVKQTEMTGTIASQLRPMKLNITPTDEVYNQITLRAEITATPFTCWYLGKLNGVNIPIRTMLLLAILSRKIFSSGSFISDPSWPSDLSYL